MRAFAFAIGANQVDGTGYAIATGGITAASSTGLTQVAYPGHDQ